MTTTVSNTSVDRSTTTTRQGTLIAAAIGFLLLYLSVDFVAPNLASSSLPLPNDPVGDTRDWYAENQLAAVVQAALQFLSVSALAVFVTRLGRLSTSPRQISHAARATTWGLVAVSLMMLASALAWMLAAVAPDASLDAVSALRTANFISGGTAHVLALGIFAVLASRIPGTTKPVRVLGYVAAVPAVLSLSALIVFEGAAFILLGRLLCMIWAISAAVSATRRLARGEWQ